MNNPFLSDKNIFSKVVNPIKKPEQKNKEPIIKSTQKISPPPSYQPSNYNNQKTTFGKPIISQKQPSFQKGNKKYEELNSLPVDESKSQYDFMQYKQQKRQIIHDQYRNNNQPSYEYLQSPNTNNKFDDYRNKNKLNQVSPIDYRNQSSKDNSGFMNLNDIEGNLNAILASSQNQDEICHMLGIAKQNKVEQKRQKSFRDQPRKVNNYMTQNSQRNHPQINNRRETNNIASESNNRVTKNKRIVAPFNPKQIQAEQQEYVPSFKPKGEESKLPTFNYLSSRAPQNQQEMNQKIPEVYNYSNVINSEQQEEDSIQTVVNRQMKKLSMQGKTRIFMTAEEKIVTVKYQPQII